MTSSELGRWLSVGRPPTAGRLTEFAQLDTGPGWRRIGEILLDLGLIDQGTLDRTLTDQAARATPVGLLDLLIEQGAISREQAHLALAEQIMNHYLPLLGASLERERQASLAAEAVRQELSESYSTALRTIAALNEELDRGAHERRQQLERLATLEAENQRLHARLAALERPSLGRRLAWAIGVGSTLVVLALVIGLPLSGWLGRVTLAAGPALAVTSATTGSAPPTTARSPINPINTSGIVHLTTEKEGGPRYASGVIVESDGLIVTNYHVVNGASSISVTLPGGRTLPARVVRVHPLAGQGDFPIGELRAGFDLALIKVDATNLPSVELGSLSEVRPAQDVVAVGYPMNYVRGGPTITKGIVSAVRPTGSGGPTFIQTTATLNQGSSGGALFDLSGRVIGITTWRDDRAEAMHFAIAADAVRSLLSS